MRQQELTLATPQGPEPRVLTFETLAVQRGASMGDLGEAALHKASTRQTPRQRQRDLDRQLERDQAWAARRAQVRADYDAMLAAGEVRQPTRRERLETIAQGHPDNDSTQAARRLLTRMDAATT